MIETSRITMYIAKISASGFLIHQVVIYGVKTLIDGGGTWKSLGERGTVFIISFLITAIAATVYDRVYISMMKKKRQSDWAKIHGEGKHYVRI